MQRFKKAVPTLLALLAGFIGGSLSTAIQGGHVHGAADVIETSRLVIVDDNDKVRGHFAVVNDIVGLAFNGSDEKPRMMLVAEPDGTPGIALLDTDTKIRLGLDVENDGVARLTLTRPDGTASVGLVMSPEGQGVIMIKDEAGKILWSAPPGLE